MRKSSPMHVYIENTEKVALEMENRVLGEWPLRQHVTDLPGWFSGLLVSQHDQAGLQLFSLGFQMF